MNILENAPLVACLALPALPKSVATARMYTRDTLKKWRLDHIVEAAELIASELVTNAIKATYSGLGDNPAYVELHDKVRPICLCLYRTSSSTVIEVWDETRTPPQMRVTGDDEEGGRGLWLVETYAKAWGFRWPRADGPRPGGTIVWAELATP
ncbi:ATP-binding protein [Sphaerimonospora mesophila]|uniref:ATP-binding protein n=1 Tax=Sphaerimonospora mesophila TaxID=37483 RepID=UPI0006E2F64F